MALSLILMIWEVRLYLKFDSYFVIFISIKGFPLTVCNLLKKHLYQNKENMYAFVKLGCSTNYDGFEANLKIVV